MLVHIKDRPVPTFVNYFLHQSFMRLNLPHTFLLKPRKTYPKRKTLYATTLHLGKPMKKHFSQDLNPTYVVKSSKPRKIIPQVFQSGGWMDSVKLKIFLQLTYWRLMLKGMNYPSSKELLGWSTKMLLGQSS